MLREDDLEWIDSAELASVVPRDTQEESATGKVGFAYVDPA